MGGARVGQGAILSHRGVPGEGGPFPCEQLAHRTCLQAGNPAELLEQGRLQMHAPGLRTEHLRLREAGMSDGVYELWVFGAAVAQVLAPSPPRRLLRIHAPSPRTLPTHPTHASLSHTDRAPIASRGT